jgi:hypothetical protein
MHPALVERSLSLRFSEHKPPNGPRSRIVALRGILAMDRESLHSALPVSLTEKRDRACQFRFWRVRGWNRFHSHCTRPDAQRPVWKRMRRETGCSCSCPTFLRERFRPLSAACADSAGPSFLKRLRPSASSRSGISGSTRPSHAPLGSRRPADPTAAPTNPENRIDLPRRPWIPVQSKARSGPIVDLGLGLGLDLGLDLAWPDLRR